MCRYPDLRPQPQSQSQPLSLRTKTLAGRFGVYAGTLLVVGFGFGLTMAAPEGMPHPWDRISEVRNDLGFRV